jgi:hypothetical protein
MDCLKRTVKIFGYKKDLLDPSCQEEPANWHNPHGFKVDRFRELIATGKVFSSSMGWDDDLVDKRLSLVIAPDCPIPRYLLTRYDLYVDVSGSAIFPSESGRIDKIQIIVNIATLYINTSIKEPIR